MATFIASLPQRQTTCKVHFTNSNETVECKPYTNLRQLAIDNDIDLYNGITAFANCEGNGLCGTCTVEVTPHQNVSVKRAKENFRFLLLKGNLRLSCQTQVIGDIEVTKHGGLKGNKDYRADLPRKEMVALYKDGKTMSQIAEQFQCPVAKVEVIFEQEGVEKRRTGSAA